MTPCYYSKIPPDLYPRKEKPISSLIHSQNTQSQTFFVISFSPRSQDFPYNFQASGCETLVKREWSSGTQKYAFCSAHRLVD